MARKNSSKSPRKSSGGTLLGMFIGLVLGVCLAAGGIAFYKFNTEPEKYPFLNNKSTSAPGGAESTPATPLQPLPLSGKPGDPMSQKRFDFHDILTGKADPMPAKNPAEVLPVPNQTDKPESKTETKPEVKPEAKPEVKPKENAALSFQAGSFSSAEDADNQKAKLALLGVEASVLQVMLQEKTFYRVRIGPYSTPQEASRIRSELAKNGIDITLIPKE